MSNEQMGSAASVDSNNNNSNIQEWMDADERKDDSPSELPFDERPLPLPKERRKLNTSLTFIEPNDSVYVIQRNGRVLCFAPTKDEIFRMLTFYKDQLFNRYTRTGVKLFTELQNDTLNVYEQNAFWLFSYSSLVASFKVLKVSHFRTQMFLEKRLNRSF